MGGFTEIHSFFFFFFFFFASDAMFIFQGYQHRLELKSAYGRMCGEPAFTNLTEEFTGTIDYIWAGSGLEVSNVLNPITKEACNGKVCGYCYALSLLLLPMMAYPLVVP